MHFPQRLGKLVSLLAICGSASCLAAEPPVPNTDPLNVDYVQHVLPILEKYCFDCHAGDEAEGDIDLRQYSSTTEIRRDTKTWIRIRHTVAGRQMPPKDANQPSDAEYESVLTWVRAFLTREAAAQDGDPGPVTLRRLNNEEYTYTLQDLTGIGSLNPAEQFPVDGAAGEGFTNTGDALAMSPSMVVKYLDAAKQVSQHAVLYSDGIGFSAQTTRRDWTDELLLEIRQFYKKYSVDHGGNIRVQWTGATSTDEDGILPWESYLAVLIEEHDALKSGATTLAHLSQAHQLNEKYLTTLWQALAASPSPTTLLVDQLRSQSRSAIPDNLKIISADVSDWQKVLWKFNPIGHIGRPSGPKTWMEKVEPLTDQQEFRIPLDSNPDDPVLVNLQATSAGDGTVGDIVVWKNARLESDDGSAIQMRDVRGLVQQIQARDRKHLAETDQYLNAVDSFTEKSNRRQVAERHEIDADLLDLWLNYLGRGTTSVEITGHFAEKQQNVNGSDYLKGWGSPATPSIVANASDQQFNIPGTVPPRAVVVHPSPTDFVAVGWRSPINGSVTVSIDVADAHVGCGNGQEWMLQHRSPGRTSSLGSGEYGTGGKADFTPSTIDVREGDVLALLVGPRNGDHGCDLTRINLRVVSAGKTEATWDLTKELHQDIDQSNPRADQYGNPATWHFYHDSAQAVFKKTPSMQPIPPGSTLTQWQQAAGEKRQALAEKMTSIVTGQIDVPPNSPDGVLQSQIRSLVAKLPHTNLVDNVEPDLRFGKHPLGKQLNSADLATTAPATVQLEIPSYLARGRTFVVVGTLDDASEQGSVQLAAALGKATPTPDTLRPATVVVRQGSPAAERFRRVFDQHRRLFPIALCYARIVPVDEAVTLTLFYREDDILQQLMLDEQEIQHLNRLWDRLNYVSQEPLAYEVAFEQIREFSTQDRPDLLVEWNKIIERVAERANAFRQYLVDTEAIHLESILQIAGDAYRKPLSQLDRDRILQTYANLREQGSSHEEAVRLTLANIFTSASFLYRLEKPGLGTDAVDVSNFELATRLSYFLWSSTPDDTLMLAAEAGHLSSPDEIQAQADRLLQHPNMRRFAIQFGCQWLHLRNFDTTVEKNESIFPEFKSLRGDIYEEVIRYLEDLFRSNRSILELVSSDHTFLNERLAQLYGFDDIKGDQWQRIEGLEANGRGGILGMASVLASQSGASRTSPILRGNWVSETLLAEKLPKPPANVPQLPDSVPEGLTARELIEHHSAVPECAKCHAKIDPYGFALEQFDSIGRMRADRVDTTTTLIDGKTITGIRGLQQYLTVDRRDDFVKQFCRKLLGYALGREVQLSDEPLLARMQEQLAANDYRFHVAVNAIVTSPQFRQIRGQAFTASH